MRIADDSGSWLGATHGSVAVERISLVLLIALAGVSGFGVFGTAARRDIAGSVDGANVASSASRAVVGRQASAVTELSYYARAVEAAKIPPVSMLERSRVLRGIASHIPGLGDLAEAAEIRAARTPRVYGRGYLSNGTFSERGARGRVARLVAGDAAYKAFTHPIRGGWRLMMNDPFKEMAQLRAAGESISPWKYVRLRGKQIYSTAVGAVVFPVNVVGRSVLGALAVPFDHTLGRLSRRLLHNTELGNGTFRSWQRLAHAVYGTEPVAFGELMARRWSESRRLGNGITMLPAFVASLPLAVANTGARWVGSMVASHFRTVTFDLLHYANIYEVTL